jgi:hypothetical protein
MARPPGDCGSCSRFCFRSSCRRGQWTCLSAYALSDNSCLRTGRRPTPSPPSRRVPAPGASCRPGTEVERALTVTFDTFATPSTDARYLRVAVDRPAASIFLGACDMHAELMEDVNVGLPFIRRMADILIASPPIWNCITSKHPGYEHEREVRLVLMGQTSSLSSYIKTRMRGSETVPYLAHPFAISTPGTIHEIVVGPSATADAEDRVRVMLASHGLPAAVVRRSKIPYRG